MCGGGGGGYSDIFIYLGLVQNFEFQNFRGFQKNENIWGMKILWIFLGSLQTHYSLQIWTIIGGPFYAS